MSIKAQNVALPRSSTLTSDRKNGRFFVFEGIDGSGKSTVAGMLRDALVADGIECELTAEPTRSWLGDAVRKANECGIDDLAEALLFMADRAEHTRQISSWLEMGKVVLCDRYYASTLAYQTALLKDRISDPMAWLRAINEKIIVVPDLTFFFQIDAEVSLDRLSFRAGRSKFEKLEFLRKVDRNYRLVGSFDRSFVSIDASRPVDQVFKDVLHLARQNL
ncbi:MAG: dTMP kinase [Methanomassiliicoccales archaeon]|nr:MAG: dTMP kinase [Methanomassiliicoccales archaeon]